jgi:hypothetical protein
MTKQGVRFSYTLRRKSYTAMQTLTLAQMDLAPKVGNDVTYAVQVGTLPKTMVSQ